MKKWTLLGVVALFLVACIRLVVTTQDAVQADVENFVAGLHYQFTATVDSVVVSNHSRNIGFLHCSVKSGRFDASVEQALATELREHSRLRFAFPTGTGFKVFLGGIDRFASSDSVVVDSDKDRFDVFRDGTLIWESKVSNTTVGKVSFAFWIPE